MKTYLYLAVGFPYTMIKKWSTRCKIEEEISPVYKQYGAGSKELIELVDQLYEQYNYNPKEYCGVQAILAASLNKEDIVNRIVWDSEGGYFSHILICRSELPFYMHDWEEEIKWLEIDPNEDDLFMSNASYKQIDKPECFKQTSGFGL